MKYNKSEIMKSAWALYRRNIANWEYVYVNNRRYDSSFVEMMKPKFSDALKGAWASAKANIGKVRGDQLKAGDVLTIRMAGAFLSTTCRIVEISKSTVGDWLVINAVSITDGTTEEFTVDYDDYYTLVA